MTKVYVETKINNFIYRKLAMIEKATEHSRRTETSRHTSGIAYEAFALPVRTKEQA